MSDGDIGSIAFGIRTKSSHESYHRDEIGPFSKIGASAYDKDAAYMPRRYKTAHAIQNDLICSLLKKNAKFSIVVDLGCGTANDGVDILSRIRNASYVGIDSSDDMLAVARRKFTQNSLQDRCLFIKCDFRSLNADDLRLALAARGLNSNISCVMSALTLHHYNAVEKRGIYSLMRSALAPGGYAIVTDLYSNSLEPCAHHALKTELEGVRKALRALGEIEKPHSTISIRHYLEENRPQPLSGDLEQMGGAGFKTADVVFRSGQLAVIAAS